MKNKDIFDFVARYEGKILPCYAENKLSTNYFKLNKSFNACFFNSDEKFASMFVREEITGGNSKVKVAILGSCFTKEAFHSLDYLNPDYKSYYENGLIGFHSSIISVVSDPIKYDPKSFNGAKDRKTINRYGDMELSKTFFEKLQKYKPDYLLIDLFIDSVVSIYQINENFFTNSFYFDGSSVVKDLKPQKTITISNEERLSLFKEALISLRGRLESIMPLDRVILIKARRSFERIDNGVVSKWPEQEWIKYANALWDRNDELFEQTIPEARIIDMRNSDKYKSMKQSPLSYSPQHLVSDYYKDLMNKFNKIVLSDFIKDKN